MIETLEHVDREIVLFINGLHNSWLDQIMWLVSERQTWIPLYIILIFFLYQKHSVKLTSFILIIIVTLVLLTDFLSVQVFKDVFLRYRPSHNLIIKNQLHLHQFDDGTFYYGGLYGFISSHAANFAAIVTFYILQMRLKWKYILALAIAPLLVGFSRVYLGVHYLSDIVVGYVFGSGMALFFYQFIYLKFEKKLGLK
jgi:undecaprenyl-diphosphatase